MSVIKNYDIRSKIITLFLIIGLFPMLFVAFFGFLGARSQMKEQVQSKLRLYLVQKRQTLKEWFHQQINTAQIMATSRDISSSLATYYKSHGSGEWMLQNDLVVIPFCENAKKRSGFNEIFLTNDQGMIICASNQMLMNANLASEGYIRRALTGEVDFSPIVYSDVTKQAILIMAVPILSDGTQGKVVGVLGCFLNIENISNQVRSGLDLIGKTADAFLVNEKLKYLSLPRTTEKLTTFTSTFNFSGANELLTAMRNQDEKFLHLYTYPGTEGNKVLMDVSILVLGNQACGLLISMEEHEIFASLDSYTFLIVFLVALFIGLVIYAGLRVSNTFANPIRHIAQTLKQIAAGDLTARVKVDGQDEIAQISQELNHMTSNLSELVSNIITSSEKVRDASHQLLTGNQNLSQRTQEQAATLEELAATIEEISGTIANTVSYSTRAESISHSTSEAVTAGEKSVKATSEAINLISTSSNKIAEITKTVNDIAFQTNILSLNAAVEAGRVGEYGRGFAVVASEIRALAARTAQYSKEINKFISDDLTLVEQGRTQVQESNEQLQLIVRNTKENSDVSLEVVAAMKEQMLAIRQIQISIEQLNQVTQHNATMVEEITDSSQSLSAEADGLSKMVNKFKA